MMLNVDCLFLFFMMPSVWKEHSPTGYDDRSTHDYVFMRGDIVSYNKHQKMYVEFCRNRKFPVPLEQKHTFAIKSRKGL